jgi:hypothetical protein
MRVANIRYSADGPVSPDRFIAALTDFSERRPELWPNLDTKYFHLHELGETWAEVTEGTDILGGIWARERYDWSELGRVRLTLVQSPHFVAGTTIDYRVSAGSAGGCHIDVSFRRIATSVPARLIGAIVQVAGARRFAGDLRTTLARLADSPA